MTLSVQLGSLELHDISNYFIPDSDNPGAWAQADGTLQFAVHIRGSSADNAASKQRAILSEINAAETAWRRGRENERVALAVQLETTSTIYFDVRGGSVRLVERYQGGTQLRVQVTLRCESDGGFPVARLAADTRATSGTLTNGAATVLLDGVTGDRPARARITITDASTSGAINRIRLSALSGETLLASDWTAWVDAVNAGSTNQTDATAFGGSYERVSLTSATAWTYLARATMPAGAMQRGWRHLYLRLRDHAATTPAPTGLGASVEAPDVPGTVAARQTRTGTNGGGGTSVSVNVTTPTVAGSTLAIAVKAQHPAANLPSMRQNGTNSGTSTSPSRNWSFSTLQGSTHIAYLRFDGAPDVWTAPFGWTVGVMAHNPENVDDGIGDVTIVGMYRENQGVDSGSVSLGSFSGSTNWACWTSEWRDIAASSSLIAVATNESDLGIGSSFSVSLDVQDVPALVVSAVGTEDNPFGGGLVSSWFGMTQAANASNQRFGVGYRLRQFSGTFAHGGTFKGAGIDYAVASMAFVAAQSEPDPIAITPPNGYALGGLSTNMDDPTRPVTTALFYRQNAPATSGNQTLTFNTSVEAAAAFVELPGLAESGVLVASAGSTDGATVAQLGPTDIVEHEGATALAVFGAYGESTSWSGWSGGFANLSTSQGLSVALLSSAEIQAWAVAAVKSASDASAHVLCVFRQTPVDSADAPGGLQTGTYAARIRAVNRGGGVGTASGTVNASVTVANSAINYSWNAASTASVSHYEIEITYAGETYLVVTEGSATSYRLETLAGLPALGFGATSVATAQVQVQVGTDDMTASTAASRNTNFEIIHTTRTNSDLAGDWHLLYGGYGHFPPQQQMADGDEPGWAVEAFGKSGGGPTANLDIDAFVLLGDESGMVLEYPGLDLATKRTWVAEVRADGSVVAWLEDGAGNYVGQVKTVGALRFAPGDNVLALVFEQADGVANVSAARATVGVTLYPTVDWLV